MARRVLGQRIITIPIEALLLLCGRASDTDLVRQKHKGIVTIPSHYTGARKIASIRTNCGRRPRYCEVEVAARVVEFEIGGSNEACA